MLALELLPTVAIAYTLSELVKPRPQRWVLLRHIRAGVELSSLLFSAGCGCAGLLLLLVVGALSLTGGDDADDPGRVVLSRYDQAALSEARSDAVCARCMNACALALPIIPLHSTVEAVPSPGAIPMPGARASLHGNLHRARLLRSPRALRDDAPLVALVSRALGSPAYEV